MKKRANQNPDHGIVSLLARWAKKGLALSANDIAAHTGMKGQTVSANLRALEKMGDVVRVQGTGTIPHWTVSDRNRNPHDNREIEIKRNADRATKKARSWYQDENLVTEPKAVKVNGDQGFVEIGRIVAIEYESDKYDGRRRIWRHDVTGKRELHVSEDGSVLIVKPGFKITKRGIEG